MTALERKAMAAGAETRFAPELCTEAKITLYIEDKTLTALMRMADMFHEKKVLAVGHVDYIEKGTSETSEDFARRVLNHGVETAKYRVVAVDVGDVFMCRPGIDEISNGTTSRFVGAKK